MFCFFQGFFMLTGAISSICKWLCVFVFDAAYSTVVEGFGWAPAPSRSFCGARRTSKNANGTFSTAIIFTDIALIGVTLNDFGILPASLKIGVAILLPVHRRFSGPLLRQRRPAEHRFRQDRSASGQAADKEHCICKNNYT